jgi:cation transport ATPase
MFVTARDHLREAGEGYWEHLRFAALVGTMLLAAGIACLVHALAPALCRRSASGIVRLVGELMADRSRLRQTARAASGPLTLVGLLLLGVPPVVLLILGGFHALTIPLALLVAGLPVAFLLSNPDLEPVA